MYSLSSARAPFSDFRENISNDGHPPFHAVQLMVWARVAGDSVRALRANSAVWGCVTLLLMGVLVFQTGGNIFCACVAVGLFALSPLAIGYAQEIRPYALSTALVCMCASVLSGPSGKNIAGVRFALLIAVSLLACFTHYWAALSVFALLSGAWLLAKDSSRRRSLVWVGAVCLFAFLFWVPVMFHQIRATAAINSFWMSPPGFKNLVLTFLTYTQLSFRFASSTFVLTHRPVLAVSIAATYAVALATGLWKGPPLIRWWLVLGIALPFALSFWKPHLYVAYRYTFIVYPAFVLIVARGLQEIRIPFVRWLLAGVLLTSTAVGMKIYFTNWEKANPLSVADYVAERSTANTVIVRPFYFSKLFGFYYRGAGRIVDENTLDSSDARLLLATQPLIFISFDVPSDPVGEALVRERGVLSRRDFPGHSRLGITVYELGSRDHRYHY